MQGRENFQNQLKQLIGSIQYSNDFDVHIALIVAPSYEKTQREKYYSDGKPPAQICREYIDLFGFMQKNPNALDILIEESKIRLRTWGGPMPDFLLTNSKLCFQLQMTPERTNYLTQGPDGVKRLKQGPEVSSYRGLKIINTRAFSLETGQIPRDILRRRVRVAEYYRIPPSASNMNREFEFYNEARDNWFSLTFADLLLMAQYRETHDFNGLAGESNAERINRVSKFLQESSYDVQRKTRGEPSEGDSDSVLNFSSQQYVNRFPAPLQHLAAIPSQFVDNLKTYSSKLASKFLKGQLFFETVMPLESSSALPSLLVFASGGFRNGLHFSTENTEFFRLLKQVTEPLIKQNADLARTFRESFAVYPMFEPWKLYLKKVESEFQNTDHYFDEMKLKRFQIFHYAVPNDFENSDPYIYPIGAFFEPNHPSFVTAQFVKTYTTKKREEDADPPEILISIFEKLYLSSELIDVLMYTFIFMNDYTPATLELFGKALVEAYKNNDKICNFAISFTQIILDKFKIPTDTPHATDSYAIWTVPPFKRSAGMIRMSDFPCETTFNENAALSQIFGGSESRKLTLEKLQSISGSSEDLGGYCLSQTYELPDSMVQRLVQIPLKDVGQMFFRIVTHRLYYDGGAERVQDLQENDIFVDLNSLVNYQKSMPKLTIKYKPTINSSGRNFFERGIVNIKNYNVTAFQATSDDFKIDIDTSGLPLPKAPSSSGESAPSLDDKFLLPSWAAHTEIVIIRPNIEHYMLGIIMGLGGDQLGNTLWGQTELSVYDDSMHGVWGMSYKYHERAIVFNEKNLVRLWDVAYDGYNGGKEEKYVKWTDPDQVDKFKDDTMEVTKNYQGASMMVMAFVHKPDHKDANGQSTFTHNFQRNWPSPILFDDNYDYEHHSGGSRPALVGYDNLHVVDTSEFRVFNNPLYSAFGEYRKLFPDFHQLHQTRKTAGESSRENETISDSLAFQGTMRIKENGMVKTEIAGSGHHGPDFTGVASIRAGKGYKLTGIQPTLGKLI